MASKFDWGGLAKVLGNAAAKVAVRAIDHARDSVLDDLDRMLDKGKERIAEERGPDRTVEPPRKVKIGATIKMPKPKKAKKPPERKPPAVQEAEIEEIATPKKPRE